MVGIKAHFHKIGGKQGLYKATIILYQHFSGPEEANGKVGEILSNKIDKRGRNPGRIAAYHLCLFI